MCILNSCVVSKIWSCKPGCAPASPAAHLCSTAYIRRDISTAWFCNCKLHWRSQCVILSSFNAQPHIFAVMNCCVVALSAFSSDILTWSADSLFSVQWHKIRGVRVEKYAQCVNKLRQNVCLETWIRRHKQRTPNTNDHHMPLNETPTMKIFCIRDCRMRQTLSYQLSL